MGYPNRACGETMIQPLRHEVRVGEWSIGYEVAGEGEPVVLVHGLSGSTRWWFRNVPAIAERHRIYLVDLPGFGAMRSLRRRFVLAETATWLSEWMEAAGLERAHLVGHSMGGYVSVRLAASRPELVPLLLAVRYATPAFIPVLVRDALRMGPSTLLRTAWDLLAEDIRVDLRNV